MSDEPINVYIFDDSNRFKQYLKLNHPSFPDRRAFFVKNDTDLKVFAHWGEKVAEDLRHEVSHGYLHSVIPSIPLWMDEGLAEYFELPRGKHGFHRQHVFHLASKVQTDDWKPDLKRLEALSDANEMTQLDYAESWLWMHYLLETKESRRKLVQDQLARLRMMGDAEPLSNHIKGSEPDIENQLLDHLTELANQL